MADSTSKKPKVAVEKIAVGPHVKDMADEVQQHTVDAFSDMGDQVKDMAGEVGLHTKDMASEIGRHTQDVLGDVGEHVQSLPGEIAKHSQQAAGDVLREVPVLFEHVKDTMVDLFDAQGGKTAK